MNNYCRNCGKKLEINEKICTKCNTKVLETRLNVTEDDIIKKNNIKKKEKIYIIVLILVLSLSLIPYFWPFSLTIIINILVYAKINLPESKIIGVLFSIITAILTILCVLMLIALIRCFYSLDRCY